LGLVEIFFIFFFLFGFFFFFFPEKSLLRIDEFPQSGSSAVPRGKD